MTLDTIVNGDKDLHRHGMSSIETMYIDWFNNFLTIGRFAEYYGISDSYAERIIVVGRTINHTRG